MASEKIDLIIMGSGSPLQKALFGSVADKVDERSGTDMALLRLENSASQDLFTGDLVVGHDLPEKQL